MRTAYTVKGTTIHSFNERGKGSFSSPILDLIRGPILGMCRKTTKAYTYITLIQRPIGPFPQMLRASSNCLPGVATRRSTSAVFRKNNVTISKSKMKPIPKESAPKITTKSVIWPSFMNHLPDLLAKSLTDLTSVISAHSGTYTADNHCAGYSSNTCRSDPQAKQPS